MERIYLAFVDTPGFFATLIHRFLKQKYIHVVLSMDSNLEEAYSVGRRNPAIPFFAGLEKEDKEKIIKVFPTAEYCICELTCTKKQKEEIHQAILKDFKRRLHIHYAILGLPFILFSKPFYQKNHYTCSSYIAKILSENGMSFFDKHFSLVTPKDFFEYENKKVVFEGTLATLIKKRKCVGEKVVEEII